MVKYTVLWFTFLLVFIFSCDKDSENEEQLESYDEYFVDLTEAREVGHLLDNELENSSDNHKKGIKEVVKVPDENGKTVFYVINLNEGYVILSADKRVEPILAYSPEGWFELDSTKYFPGGLVAWLSDQKENVKKIRREKMKLSSEIQSLWDVCTMEKIIGESNRSQTCYNNNLRTNCSYSVYAKGPLLKTTWGQGDGYNNYTPKTGCSDYDNGHAPAGCVATAMAQIMKYHEYPSMFNWGIMPNNSGNDEVSRLMLIIGLSLGMDYSCDGSSADTKKADDVFRSFGYSTATYFDYNLNTVKLSLNNNLPVLLKGGNNDGFWIFQFYQGGHAWVCDGYRTIQGCGLPFPVTHLHMNWGWGYSNRGLNGFYSSNNWSPAGRNYNDARGMVIVNK